MNPTSSFESEITQFDEARKEEQAEIKASSDQGEAEFQKWYNEYYGIPLTFEHHRELFEEQYKHRPEKTLHSEPSEYAYKKMWESRRQNT